MMKDQDKTKEQLMNELAEMRQRVAQLQEADTEHKQTKETLRESEARYRSLIDDVIDTAEAGIFILDENFRVVWVNQALERFFGLRRDRIIDRDKRELIRERIKYTFEDPETFAEKVLATYDSNTYVESFECHVLPSDEREERWLEHWSRPIRSGLYTGGRVELYYDITERKRAEEELRESEERYHSLFEGVPVGINRTTPEGQVLDANPALVQMLGYPDRETLLEVNVTDLYVDREDRRRWQALIEREGVVRGFEVQLRRHDGTIIWVRSNARAVCDADGQVLYYEGSLEDITERKRVEETLRENEELLRATLESTADGILVIGESGKMVHANTRFAEMWRIPQPVLDSRDDDTLLAFVLDQLQDPEAFLTKVRYLYGSSEEDLDTLQFKDGRVFERFSRPLLQDGMVAGRVWSFRDITEHKRADETLRESEEKYRTILENIEDGYYEVDIAGNFTFFNDSLCRLLGYPADELMGINNRQYMDDENAKKVYQTFNAVYRTGNPTETLDWEVIRKDGTRRFIETSVSLIRDSTGEPAGFRGVTRDITKRKRTEEEIKQRNRELAALNAITTAMMRSALDLNEVLQRTADGIVEGLGCNTAFIFLLDEEEGVFKGGAVSTRAKILARMNTLIGSPLLQIKIPARSDFNEAVSNLLDGRPTIKHDFYELVSPLLSKPVCSAMQRLLDSRTFFTMPLLAKGKTVGGIIASTREELSEQDAEKLMTFANQAAVAIENARLYQETQQRALEQETLREAALALTTALDRNRVIERILAQLQQVAPYDTASVQLLRENRMEIVGGRGFPNLPDLLGTSFPADGDNPNSEVIRTRAPFIVEDAPAVYEAFRKDPHRQAAGRSWLGVPMLVGEQLVGMIALDKREPGFYTQGHARLAEAFAAQAAVAIENARLFEEEKRRSTQLALINEVGGQAASILDPDRLMQEVTRSIRESFNYYNVALLLLDEEHREVVLRAIAGGFEHVTPGDYRQSIDEGIIGFVARTGNPWLANDTSKDPYYVKGFSEVILTKSELCIPIKLGDEIIGVLDVQSIRLNAFDQADVVAMEAVADRVAIAIQNARLFEETQRRALQLQTIEEIGRKVSSILDPDELFPYVAQAIQQNFGYYHVDIFFVEPATGYAVFQASSDPVTEKAWKEQGLRFKIGEEGMIGWVVQAGELLLANDVRQEPLYLPDELLPETKSELVVPLKVGKRVMGVLDVASDELNAFEKDDLFVLQTLSNQIAIAIENARLFEDARRHHEELAALNDIAMIVTSTLNLQEVLQTIQERTMELLGEKYPPVFSIFNERNETFEVVVTHVRTQALRRLEKLSGITLGEFSVPLSGVKPALREALLTGKPYVTDDGSDFLGSRTGGKLIKGAQRAMGVKCLVDLPLWAKGKLVGSMIQFSQKDRIADEEMQLLSAIANQAAIAIEKTHLFEQLEERRVYLERVLGAAPDAIVTLDAHHRVVEWNPGAEKLFGYSQEEAIGQNIDQLVTKPDVFEEAIVFTQVVMNGIEVPPTETIRYRKDGTPVDVILAGSPILVGDEFIGAVAVYTDITTRVRMEETLRALALIDDLTGLYNRRGFITLGQQQLKAADRANRRMVLLFADFDGLKQINDAFGHSEGDRALVKTANVLRETFRESDIIARIGGDEFVVLAIETNGTPAEILTTRFQEKLKASNTKTDHRYKLSLSVGLARYDPERPCSIDELLAQADRTMYEKKRGE